MHCDLHDLPDPLWHAPTSLMALVQYCGALEIPRQTDGPLFNPGGMFKRYGSEVVASLENSGSKALKPMSPT